jgi:type II restriction enzyme
MWVKALGQGTFEEATAEIESALEAEMKEDVTSLRIHLGTCSVIPEEYGHDSTEEKVYSKYTDCVLAAAFRQLGLSATVIETRADSADVSAQCADFSMVADAKAFRLSRTAKNQKDFKVTAMAQWRGSADHALLVVPLHQAPVRSSQIYRQASQGNVAIASYAHLSALLELEGVEANVGIVALERLLEVPGSLPESKDARPYWAAVREALVGAHQRADEIWRGVVEEAKQLLAVARQREMQHIDARVRAIKGLSHDEAVARLIQSEKLPQRRTVIENVGPTDVFDY